MLLLLPRTTFRKIYFDLFYIVTFCFRYKVLIYTEDRKQTEELLQNLNEVRRDKELFLIQ